MIPQKIKNRTTICGTIPLAGIYPKEMKLLSQRVICQEKNSHVH